MKSKKAAIGATITWIVATMIILLVIIIFVYAAKVFAIPENIRESENVKTSFSNSMGTEMDKQQTLLALLRTEIDGKKVEDYIFEGDYESLKNKLSPILEKFSVPSDGYWVFLVYEGDNEKLRIGKSFIYVRYTTSFVYYSNKRIEFRWEDNII